MRLLVVEDETRLAAYLKRGLVAEGFAVDIANEGEQGLWPATENDYDLILLDMSLPIMDGWEVARQLKANDDTKGIPIIALTAHAMAGDREKALEAGCDDYDTKPVEFKRLLGKIKGYVE